MKKDHQFLEDDTLQMRLESSVCQVSQNHPIIDKEHQPVLKSSAPKEVKHTLTRNRFPVQRTQDGTLVCQELGITIPLTSQGVPNWELLTQKSLDVIDSRRLCKQP